MTLSQSQGLGSTLKCIVLSATMMRQVTFFRVWFGVCSQFGFAGSGGGTQSQLATSPVLGRTGIIVDCLF